MFTALNVRVDIVSISFGYTIIVTKATKRIAGYGTVRYVYWLSHQTENMLQVVLLKMTLLLIVSLK